MSCRSGKFWVFGQEVFIDLDPDDRQVLADWLAIAVVGRVDRVIDFARRPWKVAGLEIVIGIFKTGSSTASWLLLWYEFHWVVAQVGDERKGGAVSEVCDNLAEALGLIGVGGSG